MKNQTNLRSEAVLRAIKLLAVSGASYYVEFEGQTYGQLPESAAKKPKANGTYHSGRHGHTRRTKHDLTGYNYRQRVRASKPGDLLVWEDVPNRELDSLRSAASSMAHEVHGPGASISTIKRGRGHGTVELLIVGQPEKTFSAQ